METERAFQPTGAASPVRGQGNPFPVAGVIGVRMSVNLGRRLYDLQQIDVRLEQTAEKLSRMERELTCNEDLERARAELDSIRQQQASLQQEQRTAEYAVDDLLARLKPIEEKLVRVSGSTPRELALMDKQAQLLRAQVREEEDRILEMMGQAEAWQSDAAAKAAEIDAIEQDWARRRGPLQAEQAELAAAVEADRRMRDEALSRIDPAHLNLYEKLRQTKQGSAVARIEQGRCQGCRISIPVSELTQARAGDLVQCGSCSRVLCVS